VLVHFFLLKVLAVGSVKACRPHLPRRNICPPPPSWPCATPRGERSRETERHPRHCVCWLLSYRFLSPCRTPLSHLQDSNFRPLQEKVGGSIFLSISLLRSPLPFLCGYPMKIQSQKYACWLINPRRAHRKCPHAPTSSIIISACGQG